MVEVARGVGGFNCIPEVSLAALRWCHKRPVESRAGTAGFLFDPQTLSFYCSPAPIVMWKCAIGAIGIRTVVCVWQGVRIDTPEVHYAWHSTLSGMSRLNRL